MVTIFFIYWINMTICAIYHAFNNSRNPKSVWEFVKMTFLPWVLLNSDKLKR